jgi:hypothetical protein
MTSKLSSQAHQHTHQVYTTHTLVVPAQVVQFRLGKRHMLLVVPVVCCWNRLRMASMMFVRASLGMFLRHMLHRLFVLLCPPRFRLSMECSLCFLSRVQTSLVRRLCTRLVLALR